MGRRLGSLFAALLLAATVVGFQPTPVHAAPGAITMQGPVTFLTPAPTTGPWCTTVVFHHTWLISTTAYVGPMPVNGSGTLCGTVPGFGTWTFFVVGTVNIPGVATGSMTCSGSGSGVLPGTLFFHLECTLTVTTPFTDTTTNICADGVVTFEPYILGVLAGAGATPC